MPPKSAPKPASKAAPAKEEKPAAKSAPKAEQPAAKTAEKPAATASKGAAKSAEKPAEKAKTAPAAAAPVAAATAPAKAAAPAKKAKAAGGGSANNGVYIKNWGSEGSESLRAFFGSVGKISGTRLRRNRYAIVYYENPASVKKAVDTFNGKNVKGREVEVSPAVSGPKVKSTDGCKTVFVSPIFAGNTSRKQVRDQFQGYGKIVKLSIYRGNYAFVYYSDAAAAAKAAKEKTGAKFLGQALSVKLSKRTKERDEARAAKGVTRSQLLRFKRQNPTVVAAAKK